MSWGATWGARWGGGASAAPAAAAATVTPASGALGIITRFRDVIEATGSGLLPANPRFPLELGPAGVNRVFEVRLTSGRIARQFWGAGKAFLGATAVVRVAYSRPGGDAGGGDRTSVNIQAGEDSMLIADALCDGRNWDRENTFLRKVTLDLGAVKVADDRLREIWETRVAIEYQSPWPV